MSDIKCPFCQQELEKDDLDVQLFGCENQNCKYSIHYGTVGTKELWQELIRTRKALEIAVDALKDNLSQANFTQMLDASRFHCIRTKCETALEQITAVQKE